MNKADHSRNPAVALSQDGVRVVNEDPSLVPDRAAEAPTDDAGLPEVHGGTPPDAAVSPEAPPSDETYQRRLGERLRTVRRSQGMRLQDVEERSDGRFKAVVIGSYERGDRAVSAHKLAALAAFYGVPVGELLPEDEWPRAGARDRGVQIAVDRLRIPDLSPELAPLRRLVQHVQWLRGDYNGRVLSLRGDDLRTVAVALGVEPEDLGSWLADRDLLAEA